MNHWAKSGELLYQWRPVAPGVRTICSLGGQPAVAGQAGVVVRDEDGRSVAVGADALAKSVYAPIDAAAAGVAYGRTRMACTDAVAYVLSNHVITAYRSGEPLRHIPVPPEVEEIARQREAQRFPGVPGARFDGYRRLVVSDGGRLVVTTPMHPEIEGAVVDPAAGCYELLKTDPIFNSRHLLGMMADSLVFVEAVAEPETRTVDGKVTEVTHLRQRAIAIRPVRLASGERCPIGGE